MLSPALVRSSPVRARRGRSDKCTTQLTDTMVREQRVPAGHMQQTKYSVQYLYTRRSRAIRRPCMHAKEHALRQTKYSVVAARSPSRSRSGSGTRQALLHMRVCMRASACTCLCAGECARGRACERVRVRVGVGVRVCACARVRMVACARALMYGSGWMLSASLASAAATSLWIVRASVTC
eukprot:6195314-Pleurochrysis_carterae.AAC.1